MLIGHVWVTWINQGNNLIRITEQEFQALFKASNVHRSHRDIEVNKDPKGAFISYKSYVVNWELRKQKVLRKEVYGEGTFYYSNKQYYDKFI